MRNGRVLFAHRYAVSAFVFGDIHGLVGAGDKSLEIGGVFIRGCHANTDSDDHRMAAGDDFLRGSE
jgi:hypothetical protein